MTLAGCCLIIPCPKECFQRECLKSRPHPSLDSGGQCRWPRPALYIGGTMFNITVLPVALTQVNHSVLNQHRRFDNLDAQFIKPDTLLGYLACMIKEGDIRKAVRDVNYLLRHISASFLILATEKDIQEIRFYSSLNISVLDEDKYLITGTLEDWKIASIDLCKKESTPKTRFILNCCVLCIEKADLMDVFGNFGKQTLLDQTFIFHRKE
jgi:hypothetical protein